MAIACDEDYISHDVATRSNCVLQLYQIESSILWLKYVVCISRLSLVSVLIE